MTLGEIISAGLVLQSIGIVALTSTKGTPTAEPAPSQNVAATASYAPEEESRNALRKAHAVQLISKQDEGDSIFKVPTGVYGFTYAPASESPVFSSRCYKSFEMHKAADGTPYLIGFVSPEEADAARNCEPGASVKVYPEAYGEAAEIVALPADRIQAKTLLTRRDEGNWIQVRIL